MVFAAVLIFLSDMDNPFEVGKGSHADVDLFLLWDLEKELTEMTGQQQK